MSLRDSKLFYEKGVLSGPQQKKILTQGEYFFVCCEIQKGFERRSDTKSQHEMLGSRVGVANTLYFRNFIFLKYLVICDRVLSGPQNLICRRSCAGFCLIHIDYRCQFD